MSAEERVEVAITSDNALVVVAEELREIRKTLQQISSEIERVGYAVWAVAEPSRGEY